MRGAGLWALPGEKSGRVYPLRRSAPRSAVRMAGNWAVENERFSGMQKNSKYHIDKLYLLV